MKVLLNDRELNLSFGADASLGEVLADVQDNDIMDNQVLAGIWIDGEELTSESLSVLGGRCVREFGEARIEAPTREEMALHGICTLIDSLNASIGVRDKLVDDICQGRAGQAIGGLSDYLSVWVGLQQTLGGVARLLEMELGELASLGAGLDSPLEEQVANLGEHLSELKGALEAGDLVLIGDVLEYEFGDLTRGWVETLEIIGKGLSEKIII